MPERNRNKTYSGADWDCILNDILKSWWMILLAALSAALIAGSVQMMRYEPRYNSSTTFIIGKAGFTNDQVYDNLKQAETTVNQYAQVVNSSILKEKVCEELSLDSFDASVTVNEVSNTNLMVMTVSAKTPSQAFLINRSVRKNAIELMGYFLDGVTLMELEAAAIPERPANPLSLSRNMRMAALIGAAAMIFLLGWISFRKDTIRTQEDISRKVDAKLLGTIYYEKKKGRSHLLRRNKKSSLLIDDPMLSFEFAESYRMLATRVRLAMEMKNQKVLMVTSVSENEGKSTVAANLALALANEGKTVLLADFDFRKPSLYKIFSSEITEENDITRLIENRRNIMVNPLDSTHRIYAVFSSTPRENPWDKESMAYIERFLNYVRKHVDFIIMDTSPTAFVSDSEEYAELADAALLVIRQDVMESSYINDAIDNLEETGTEVIGCVFNNVRKGLIGRTRESVHYGGAYNNYSHYRKRQESGKDE